MAEPLSAVDALIKLGGIADTAALVTMSSRKRVRTAIRRGKLVRVTRNCLSLPVTGNAHTAARERSGHLSHLSAALHHGWEIKFPPDMPQVTVDDRQELPDPDELSELATVFRRRLVVADREGWATSPLRTVLDCARDLPFVDALCVADSALRHGSLTHDELLETAAHVTGRQAHRVRRVAEYADGAAANPFESALRALAIEAGLPVLPQYEVSCGGMTCHPDLANPILGIVLEADSYEFHGMRKTDHARDCRRYNALTTEGWLVLRFTWEQVMENPAYVITTIRTAMALIRPA